MLTIQNLDSIAAAIFPSKYTPQFSIVAPVAERAALQEASDTERRLYALEEKYSEPRAIADYDAALGSVAGVEKSAIDSREKLPTRAEVIKKYAELAQRYSKLGADHRNDVGHDLVIGLAVRVEAAVAAFELAAGGFEAELSAAAGIKFSMAGSFEQALYEIRHALKQHLAVLASLRGRSFKNPAASVGDFVEGFVGLKFQSQQDFTISALK